MPIGPIDGQLHDEGVFRGVAPVEVEEEWIISSQSFALVPNLLVQLLQLFDCAWCRFGAFGRFRERDGVCEENGVLDGVRDRRFLRGFRLSGRVFAACREHEGDKGGYEGQGGFSHGFPTFFIVRPSVPRRCLHLLRGSSRR